jgi:PAS domain S-box-containing protein
MEQNMEFALVVADTTGTIQSVNEEAELLFGHSAKDLIGETLDVLVPEPYRGPHWAGFRGLMASDDTGLDRGAVIIPVQHGDGAVAPHGVRLMQLRDPWGRAIGAMAVFAVNEPEPGEFPPLPEL